MPDGRHTPDGKSCLRADLRRIGACQCFSYQSTCARAVHLPPACRDEKDRCTALRSCENDRLCDLVNLAANQIGGHLCGRRLAHLAWGDVLPPCAQRGDHPFEAFAHVVLLSLRASLIPCAPLTSPVRRVSLTP